jgi:broad specificity phosphatase PhoE
MRTIQAELDIDADDQVWIKIDDRELFLGDYRDMTEDDVPAQFAEDWQVIVRGKEFEREQSEDYATQQQGPL